MMKKKKRMKAEEEFLQAAQSLPKQVFEKPANQKEQSTSRDEEGNVIKTAYKLDSSECETLDESTNNGSNSSGGSFSELQSSRELMNESNMS